MLAVFSVILNNLLTAPRTVSNMYAQVAMAHSCANHVQQIERLSRAICRVPRGDHQTEAGGEKTPDDELKKMPHAKARRLKPHVRLEPAQ